MFAIWKYSSYISTDKVVDFYYVLETLQKFTQFPKRTIKNYTQNYFLFTEVKPNSFLQCAVQITGTELRTIHATCVTDAAR
jgi:hypothetical protein